MTDKIEIPAFITNDQREGFNRAHKAATTRCDPIYPYIENVHSRAVRLHGVLCAIDYLDNESACADGMSALIHTARDLSEDLQLSLDSVNFQGGCTNG